MPDVRVKQHQWVKIVMVPVEVLADDRGEPVVFVDPDRQEEAEEDANYGCRNCSVPLEGYLNTECEEDEG